MEPGVQWVVKVDPQEMEAAIEGIAELLGIYYRAVQKATGNAELSMRLTVEYQRLLLAPVLAREMNK